MTPCAHIHIFSRTRVCVYVCVCARLCAHIFAGHIALSAGVCAKNERRILAHTRVHCTRLHGFAIDYTPAEERPTRV